MTEKHRLIYEILAVGRRLDGKGLIAGTGGNMSAVYRDHMLITASGKCKGVLQPGDVTETDLSGNVLKGSKPARDIRMHLAVYQLRPETRAIVHMHPPVLTGFAITDYAFEEMFLPEVMLELRGIAVARFAMPTTAEVAEAVSEALRKKPHAKAIVLKGHGAVALSDEGVMDACYKMEVLEMTAKALFVASVIGEVQPLTEKQVSIVKAYTNL